MTTDQPPSRLVRMKRITRTVVQAHPDWIFVFGDNCARVGLGGQAKEMRGEPNSFGVVTKWSPGRALSSYFTDSDWLLGTNIPKRIQDAFNKIEAHLWAGKTIVIPSDGLGTGLAELPTRAPKIHAYIEQHIARLEAIAKEME